MDGHAPNQVGHGTKMPMTLVAAGVNWPLSTDESGRETRTVGVAPRLHERAFRILAAQIVQGALRPGTVLLESHIARQFGISRAPARQALARLESDGLVARAAGHGYMVVAPADAVPAASAPSPPPAAPVRLAAESTWERIYAEVEQEIVSHAAFGAWRVVENHLAGFYGVSRTVARDVLSRLQQRGMVRKDARQRWYAPALSRDYVAELYEMRALLEPQALIKAAPRLPAPAVAGLRQRLEAAMADAARRDGDTLSALETELHVTLLGHCGNATLMEAVSKYQSLLVAHTFLYCWAPQFHSPEPFLAEHLAVAEHLSAGRIDDAGGALRTHLNTSLARAMHRLDVVRRDLAPTPLPYLDRL